MVRWIIWGDQQIYKFIATYGHHNTFLQIKLQILRAERDQSFLKFGNKNIEISVSLQNGVDWESDDNVLNRNVNDNVLNVSDGDEQWDVIDGDEQWDEKYFVVNQQDWVCVKVGKRWKDIERVIKTQIKLCLIDSLRKEQCEPDSSKSITNNLLPGSS